MRYQALKTPFFSVVSFLGTCAILYYNPRFDAPFFGSWHLLRFWVCCIACGKGKRRTICGELLSMCPAYSMRLRSG